MRFEEAATA